MNSDLNSRLGERNLKQTKKIEVGGGRKAIIIFVPVPQLKSFQKIQVRLVRELEKKFSGKHVVFIAQVSVLLLKILFPEFDQILWFKLCW